ncbi:MAG: OmpA family protein [Tannerella sp.]|jgi:outer membrane protein OmpA-like peptidoglycan-associated protein|nr:OmpA family protein [Tannerella sp.]
MKQIRLLTLIAACATLLLTGCGTGKSVSKDDAEDENDAPTALIGGEAGAAVGRHMQAQKEELRAMLPGEVTVETANRGEALRLTFRAAAMFSANSSTLAEPSRQALRLLAAYLNDHPGTSLRIVGHTDSAGRAELNRSLSSRRAKSVCDLLAANGVDAARMTAEGKGIHYPVADNDTEEGRALNRRIEIFVMPGDEMIREARMSVGE